MKILKKPYVLFMISCMVVAGFFVLIYDTVGIYYIMNDDISMRNIVSGSADGIQHAHMVYIKYVVGFLLSNLYKIRNNIDWYGLFMLGTMAISIAALLYKFSLGCIRKKQYGLYACCVLIMVFLFYKQIFSFQWTIVAAFPAVAAIVLLLLKEQKYRFDWETVLIIFLSVLSFSIRTKVFYMAMPVIFLILVAFYFIPLYKDEKEKIISRKTINIVSPIAIILLLFVIIHSTDTIAYKNDSEWNEYRQFNSARARILDYGKFPEYEGNEIFYDEIGLTKEAVDCLPMFGLMPDIDAKTFKQIAEYVEVQRAQQSASEDGITKMLSLLKSVVTDASHLRTHLMVVVLFLLQLLNTFRYKRNVILKVSFWLAEIVMLSYLLYKGRFPDRIVIVYELYIIFFCLALLLYESKTDNGLQFQKSIMTGVLVLILSFFSYERIQTSLESKQIYEFQIAKVESLNSYVESQENEIVVVGTGLVSAMDRFTVWEDVKVRNKLGTAGWSTHSPYLENKKEMLEIYPGELFLLKDNAQLLARNIERVEDICEYYSIYTDNPVTYSIEDTVVFSDGTEAQVFTFYEQKGTE